MLMKSIDKVLKTNSTLNLTSAATENVITSEDVAVIVAYGAIALTSLLGNGITIAIILRNPTFHTLYNFLLLNLAAADFITGFVSLVEIGIIAFGSQTDVLCKIFTGIIYCNIMVSINTLTAIAFERYSGIMKPIVHRNRSSKRLKFVVISVWLSSVVTATVVAREIRMDETTFYCFVSNDERDWPTWKLTLGWLALVTIFVTPSVTITFLYGKIVLRFKSTGRSPTDAVSENTNGTEVARKRAAKTVRMSILVTILFGVALLPELVFFFLVLYDRKYVDARLFFKIGIPTVASIAVNPFVYTLSNPTFRQEAKRLFLCCRRGNSAGMTTSQSS